MNRGGGWVGRVSRDDGCLVWGGFDEGVIIVGRSKT